MGKRKERRLAALSNASRRVKLDLFVEPSGDLGGSSVNDKVGGDIDPTQRAGLPNSPSSSGQQPENPLLLLGQYSDDELDEEYSKGRKHTIAETSPADHNDQDVPFSEGNDMDANVIEDHAPSKVEKQDMERNSAPVDDLQSLEDGDTTDSEATTAFADTLQKMDSLEQISVAGTPNAQGIGDVSSGWRMVMHEESNRYYYWNTETGETSWEVPAVLAQIIPLSSDQKTSVTENAETAHVCTGHSSSILGVELNNSPVASTVDVSVGTNSIPQSKVLENGPQMDGWVEGYRNESLTDKNWVTDVYQGELQGNLSTVSVPSGDGSFVVSECMHGMVAKDENKRGMDPSTSLMKHCKCLLEKLKSLKGYDNCQQGHDRILKYNFEVEIRLSDIKSLSSYGSSLLPFWSHSERQLKHLEDIINNEIYQLAVSAQMDDNVDATTDSSFKEKKKSQEDSGHESEEDGCESGRKSEIPPLSTNVEKDSNKEADYRDIYVRHAHSIGSPSGNLESVTIVGEEVNGTAHQKPEVHVFIEDVDMDVDMEVEDVVPANIPILGDASSKNNIVPAEQHIQPNGPALFPPLSAGDTPTVPPPPEEEWIPPLPPDNDQVPPLPPDNEQVPSPPPDEPPESSYPPVPSYTENGQPLAYAEQYALGYPDSNFQYYGHTVTVPSGNLYGHTDGSRVAIPHASLYYEPVPETYTETAPILVGPVQTLTYYNVQDGSLSTMPVVNSAESSQLQIESGSVSYDAIASDQNRTTGDPAEADPNAKHDVLAVSDEMGASTGLSSTLTATQAPASAANVVTATAAVPAPSTVAKSKVGRSKKRTVAVAPSLRSNKKVSSLVDKWKAAKEELNENEDDEPENAYEILEKKRQREIEEWHAKQIASREAKDNANFQPLGGDWRERVKRRRAQTTKEAAQTPPKTSADENQQPDLEEVSKGLPPGWQAYWDDASKQVYYGNVVTLETTWSKPTK